MKRNTNESNTADAMIGAGDMILPPVSMQWLVMPMRDPNSENGNGMARPVRASQQMTKNAVTHLCPA